MHILFVDNDVRMVRSWFVSLELAGHDVTMARSLVEAEAVFSSQRFDVVILDVMMPLDEESLDHGYSAEFTDHGRVSGLELFRRLKPRAHAIGCRLAVLTSRLDSEIAERFIEAGLDEFAYATKLQMRRVDTFLDWIADLGFPRDTA